MSQRGQTYNQYERDRAAHHPSLIARPHTNGNICHRDTRTLTRQSVPSSSGVIPERSRSRARQAGRRGFPAEVEKGFRGTAGEAGSNAPRT